jgi:hypothetical protein
MHITSADIPNLLSWYMMANRIHNRTTGDFNDLNDSTMNCNHEENMTE